VEIGFLKKLDFFRNLRFPLEIRFPPSFLGNPVMTAKEGRISWDFMGFQGCIGGYD